MTLCFHLTVFYWHSSEARWWLIIQSHFPNTSCGPMSGLILEESQLLLSTSGRQKYCFRLPSFFPLATIVKCWTILLIWAVFCLISTNDINVKLGFAYQAWQREEDELLFRHIPFDLPAHWYLYIFSICLHLLRISRFMTLLFISASTLPNPLLLHLFFDLNLLQLDMKPSCTPQIANTRSSQEKFPWSILEMN